ncbi:hypothetical protein [Streptomyces sp. NPDC052496]|uniref:bacteriocin-associated integral membrane family protein n=1 Tax=Streptomyces sp. NPDC052496 TaxID=3154951 RepID=UPI00341AAF35
MLHRGIKFVYAAVFAFSAMVAFLFLRGLDEHWVLGHSAVVWALESDDSTSGAQVARDVASFAADHRVSVAREVPDLKDPDGRRHLYLTSGDPGSEQAEWLDSGYPSFGRDYRTEVHPLTEIGQRDPRGFYYVFGPPETGDALVREFAGLGLRASVHHPLSFAELAPLYLDGVLAWSLGVIALAAVTMTGAGVLLNAKTYGVLRLQGKSFAAVFLRDLRQLAAFSGVTVGLVIAAVMALLGLYNGLAWLRLFALMSVSLAGLLVILILATHGIVLALTFKTDVLRALKGELPARTASFAVYLVRVPALLLALSIATSVVLAGQDIASREDSRTVYAKVGATSAIRLNGSLGDRIPQMEAQVGRWLRQSDAAGKVIVAGRRELRNISPGALPQGELLIVNERFLAEQPILDPQGHPYPASEHGAKSARRQQVRLFVPESLSQYAATIADRIPGLLSPAKPELISKQQVRTLTAKNGHRVFGYNPGDQAYTAARNSKEDRSLVRDPVIVAVPNGSHFLTNNAYTAFATQGGVVFPDPDDIRTGISRNKLETYVVAIRPVGQNAALQMRDAVNDFRLQIFDLLMALAVLLITGVGVCIVYSRKNAQSIFVKHFSGWRFTANHRTLLAVEGLLAVLLAAWVPFHAWQQNQDLKRYAALGIPAPRPPVQVTALDFGVTTGLIVVEVGAVLVALAFFHRRIAKEGAVGA